MTLADYTLPVPYEDCRGLALVYSYEIAVQWYTIQQENGDPRHVAVGLPLTDGRWMMLGEVLSQVHPSGILAWVGDFLTPAIMNQIEVVSITEALGMLQHDD